MLFESISKIHNSNQIIKNKYIGIVLCSILVAITMYSFYPAIHNEFVQWDDQEYILENPLITQPTAAGFKHLFTEVISLNYHPITMISLWLNAKIDGTNTATHFIGTNLILHILNVLLVFTFIRYLFDNNNTVAFFSALVFAIHPMHVESVIWVAERKDVLYAFNFLLAAVCYIKYIDLKSNKWLCLSIILFILSCLSKAMAVSLVPVLYLIDHLRKRSFYNKKIHFEKLPFILIALLFGSIAINVQQGGDFYGLLKNAVSEGAVNEIDAHALWSKIQFASYGIYFYCKQFFFPFHLSALHPYSSIIGQSYLSCLPIITIAYFALLIYAWFKNRTLAFCLGFFLFTIILVLQFIQVGSAVVAERYTYLPYIGLGTLLGFGFYKLWHTKHKNLVYISFVLIAIYFSQLTRAQVQVWQNSKSLFENVVVQYPNDALAREFLASVYNYYGEPEKAIYHLNFSINYLKNNTALAYNMLAFSYELNNDFENAILSYNKAIDYDKTNALAYFNRAMLLLNNRPQQAINDFNICALYADEGLSNKIYEPIAEAFGKIGEYELSIANYSKAIEMDNNKSELYYNRGVSYERMGELERAKIDYNAAIQIDPKMVDAKERLIILDEYT